MPPYRLHNMDLIAPFLQRTEVTLPNMLTGGEFLRRISFDRMTSQTSLVKGVVRWQNCWRRTSVPAQQREGRDPRRRWGRSGRVKRRKHDSARGFAGAVRKGHNLSRVRAGKGGWRYPGSSITSVLAGAHNRRTLSK